MRVGDLIVIQSGNGQYDIFTEQNVWLCRVACPADGQLAYDLKTLEPICRVLAVRWGIATHRPQSRPREGNRDRGGRA